MNTRETVGRPMEILLVEDSLVDARLTIEALRVGNVNHRLTLIRNGDEAREFLVREGKFARAPKPDLILLDLHLPGMDGRELMIMIKSDPELKEIALVVLTASEAHEDVLRGQQLHVDGYMIKPLDMDKFLSLIRQLREFWHADVILPVEA
jgi:CheY-like chemotaxis protein